MSPPSQLTLVSTSTQMTCHHPLNWHWCLPLHRGHAPTLTTDTGVSIYTEDMSLPSQFTPVSTSTQMTCHHPHNWHWCLPLHRGHAPILTTDTGVYLYTEDMSLPSQLTLVSTSTQMTCHCPHNWHWCLPLHRWHVTALTTDTGVYLYTDDMSPPSQLKLVSTSTQRTCPTLTLVSSSTNSSDSLTCDTYLLYGVLTTEQCTLHPQILTQWHRVPSSYLGALGGCGIQVCPQFGKVI